MSDLIAIGYPDETTAQAAADEAQRRAKDLTIEPDAIAVIVRDTEGKFHVHTSHHSVEDGQRGGCSGGAVRRAVLRPVLGSGHRRGLGAIMGKVTKAGVDNVVGTRRATC